MGISIRLHPFFAKEILRFNPFDHVLVVCKGYNADDESFTELIWADDKGLDFYDSESYSEFQMWIQR